MPGARRAHHLIFNLKNTTTGWSNKIFLEKLWIVSFQLLRLIMDFGVDNSNKIKKSMNENRVDPTSLV